jgi:hypothetical protein
MAVYFIHDVDLIPNSFWRKKMIKKIAALTSSDTSTRQSRSSQEKATPTYKKAEPSSKSLRTLPPGKKYDYFGYITLFLTSFASCIIHIFACLCSSHKKEHTLNADASEQLGLRVKDVLEANNGMVGFFDGVFLAYFYSCLLSSLVKTFSG